MSDTSTANPPPSQSIDSSTSLEQPDVENKADHNSKLIEDMERRQKELDEEEAKINELMAGGEKANNAATAALNSSSTSNSSYSSPDADHRSVYVGSVDYSSTVDDLQQLFSACGPVNRVTILTDKYTGQSKGFAYIEFKDVESVQNALILNDTEFKGRQLKVTPKRTNVPAFQRGRGRGRGMMNNRGGRGGGVATAAGMLARGGANVPPRGRGSFQNKKAVYTPY
jgi:polyadenylate-binding protein 2